MKLMSILLTVVRQVSHDERSGATTVSHLEAVDVGAPDRVASLLDKAMRQRAVGATALNEHSSRSHMVFMLSICGSHAASGQSVSGACICRALVERNCVVIPVNKRLIGQRLHTQAVRFVCRRTVALCKCSSTWC